MNILKFSGRNVYNMGLFAATFLTCLLGSEVLYAAAAQDLGKVAEKITGTFENVAKLITAGSYIAGLGFSIGAIMKFKQHKDNPTQITIGTPIALLFIAAALLFLPSILDVAGGTLFDDAKVAGAKGLEYKPGS